MGIALDKVSRTVPVQEGGQRLVDIRASRLQTAHRRFGPAVDRLLRTAGGPTDSFPASGSHPLDSPGSPTSPLSLLYSLFVSSLLPLSFLDAVKDFSPGLHRLRFYRFIDYIIKCSAIRGQMFCLSRDDTLISFMHMCRNKWDHV